ncbi:hypothetical protein Fmac_026514 [Flemingia macrophylla]|uniref:Uncharacterized protein n=1 Tax=Flemingia macrophylla TaxID=520843 RepID=A0ABD1LF24_9FABA
MPTFYMDDVGASSQSSLPTVHQEAPNPEPPEPHPDPDLSLPLLDDNTRRAELDERAGFHFVELSEDKKDKVLNAQVQIERAIEKALLSDGYSRDELSQRNKRDEIRAFLFYPKGKLLSIKTYESYVKEVEFGTHRSQPYKIGLTEDFRAGVKSHAPVRNCIKKDRELHKAVPLLYSSLTLSL